MASNLSCRRAGAALLLIAGIIGGCATDQPVIRSLDLAKLPKNVADAIHAGFPHSVIDSVETSTGMAGSAYIVWYHVGQSKYRAEFLAYKRS